MFTNKYPYTDLSQLNLDWFLSQFKSMSDRIDQLETDTKPIGYIEFDYSGNVNIIGDIVNTGIIKFVNKTSEPTLKAVYNPAYKMIWLVNVMYPFRWNVEFVDYTDSTKTNRITFDYQDGEYKNITIAYNV